MFPHRLGRVSLASLPVLALSQLWFSCSALTMLPTLTVSLLPDFDRAGARPEVCRQGVLDLSAAEAKATRARSRAIVHVAFMSVRCPVGHRCAKSLVRENLRQRPLSLLTGCLKPGGETIARGEASLRRCTLRFRAPLSPHAKSPRPPMPRQGGPSNQERSCSYEERNVGQCLAARGVPHRHR
jgi:hypothetical protein